MGSGLTQPHVQLKGDAQIPLQHMVLEQPSLLCELSVSAPATNLGNFLLWCLVYFSVWSPIACTVACSNLQFIIPFDSFFFVYLLYIYLSFFY